MKHFVSILMMVILPGLVFAQAPQSFRYQAVARDNSGNVLTNQAVSFRISILSGSAAGSTVYRETHTGKTTNTFGLVELEIGKGTPETGTFSSINWGNNSYFVKVEMDPAGGTAYQVLSTSQLLSVPYALHAKTVETGDNWGTQTVTTDATISGNGTTATPLKLSQQSATSGQVLKWNGSTWYPGSDETGNGFSLPFIGSVSTELAVPAFKVTNTGGVSGIHGDVVGEGATIRTGLIGTTHGKNGVGVYGYNESTSGYTWGVYGVTKSASGIGVFGVNESESGSTEGIRGISYSNEGIGVSGTAGAQTGNTIGVKGIANSPSGIGVYGSAPTWGIKGETTASTGYSCGVFGITNSPDGIALNGESRATTGNAYGVLGASWSTTGYGVAGVEYAHTGENYGVFGSSSSSSGVGVKGVSTAATGPAVGVFGSSNSNTGVAVRGYANSSLGQCIAINGKTYSDLGFSGYFEGGTFYVQTKIGIGTTSPGAGLHIKGSNFPGSFMFIEASTGNDAGIRLYEGSTVKWHIFNNVAAGGLQIYNSGGTPAIFVKQSNSYVGIGTTNPTYPLHVNGDAAKTAGTTAWVISSDRRLKDIHGNYEKGLDEIVALQPVKFNYKKDNPRQLPSETELVGFVAQDVQKVFPEAVKQGEDGYLDFNIHSINVAMVNAIKELKAENELLKTRLEKIEAQLNASAEK